MQPPPRPGAHLCDGGITFGVLSHHADAIEFCWFDADGHEHGRWLLANRLGDLHYDFIPGIAAGTPYGLRAQGRFDPARGLRFNPAKLLLDPYATKIDQPFRLHPAQLDTGAAPDPTDSAPFVPKAITEAAAASAVAPPPMRWDLLSIYELHIRGFSLRNDAVPAALRGTFAGLAHPASISYLRDLGVTAVEIMPCAAWADERHLQPLGLSNYWGYNPVTFNAPDPRLAPGGLAEIAATVAALRQAGIATILDVVFNHTAESDEFGPTLSLRGLDNASYYRLRPDDASQYCNESGCGNVLAADRPIVIQLIMDSLRVWAVATGVDGFRFDLAVTLGRDNAGFDPAAPLLAAIRQDPVLRERVLIAEPWDIGPGGHRTGAFGAPWGEWNDRYRDTVRRFWRGDRGSLAEMATRLAGSEDIFAPSFRPPSRSINYITAHDGFTLQDLVSYAHKHNEANGEENRDGANDNISWNNGAEGPAEDAGINHARATDAAALLATLLFSRGTPMLCMGDEAGRTQRGNNNAYAQDNDLSWFDWAHADPKRLALTRQLVALRRMHAPLRADQWLRGTATDSDGLADVTWLRCDGTPMRPEDWHAEGGCTLIALLYAEAERVIVVLHAGHAPCTVTLPPPRAGHSWNLRLDSAAPEILPIATETIACGPRRVLLLVEQPPRNSTFSAATGDDALRHFARQAGLATSWRDVEGIVHVTPVPTLRALLAALHLPAANARDVADGIRQLTARQREPMPKSLVAFAGERAKLPLGPDNDQTDRWLIIASEDGREMRHRIGSTGGAIELTQAADGSRFATRRVTLPELEAGRYTLRFDRSDTVTFLTIAPRCCYLPDMLVQGRRAWGISAHLYSMRHARDQGIGDFTALSELARTACAEGASLIGLNPLHALFRHDPERASPYHPADRRVPDLIYIDVTDLGPLGEPAAVRAALAEAAPIFDSLRTLPRVNYTDVRRCKETILHAAFDAAQADAPTTAALDAFIAAGGRELATFTAWETLAAEYGSDWRNWPDSLRNPDSAAVASHAAARAHDMRFSAFLQYLADRALAAAAKSAREAGCSIGLYRDLAVGCAPDGAEAWSEQSLLLAGVSVGAPPDPLGPRGQNWCLPAPNPVALANNGYRSFARLLAANMRHAGALRIDHAMGLARLFLIPDGADPQHGTYLAYPTQDMIGQVTLESARAKCLVVGEDLGTVPPGFDNVLQDARILSYRVLWFEKDNQEFRPPAAWPSRAAACVSTHDLPTLPGWWLETDIAEQQLLGLLNASQAATARAERAQARRHLLALLRAEGFALDDTVTEPPLAAIYALIARTPSLLALVQADDLTGETEMLNLPGTDRERPNWRRRLRAPAAALQGHPVFAAMRAERNSL